MESTREQIDHFLCVGSSGLAEDVVESISEKADQYLQSLADNKTFSGSVLLARRNQIILLKGYGCSEYGCGEKNTSETIYRIGSVTKPFTAILTLKLLERRQLKLTNRLSEYFPDYPDGNRITIKHLLSNTSGIEDYTELETFEQNCSKNLSIDELINLFRNEPLKFAPGSKYEYSNSNVRFLSLVRSPHQVALSFDDFLVRSTWRYHRENYRKILRE